MGLYDGLGRGSNGLSTACMSKGQRPQKRRENRIAFGKHVIFGQAIAGSRNRFADNVQRRQKRVIEFCVPVPSQATVLESGEGMHPQLHFE